MSWNTNPLIIRKINEDIKNALQSGDILSLQNNLSLLPPVVRTDGNDMNQRTRLVKEIEVFIQRAIDEAIRQNKYELFYNAINLYKTPVMLNDPIARRNYAALIQEFDPRFDKFFKTPEEKQKPVVLANIIITKESFEAKVAAITGENKNRTLTHSSDSSSSR
jgi:hypothetical protein